MNLKYIILIGILYIFFHNPDIPYLPFALGTIKLLYIPLVIFLLQQITKRDGYAILFKSEYLALLIVISYVFIRTIFGGDPIAIRTHLVSLIEIFLLPLFIIYRLQNVRINNKEKFIRCILVVGVIGSVISTISYLIPGIQDHIRNHFMHLKADAYLNDNTWRGFGISEGLTSHYSFIQACILSLALFYYKKNKWIVLFVPGMILSIIFNARTGILIFLIAALLNMVYRKNIIAMIAFGIIALFIVRNFDEISVYIGMSNEASGSLSRFGDSIYDLYETGGINEGSGAIYALLVDMWVLPGDVQEWMIGRGFSLYDMEDKIGVKSDVGFINTLAYGGLIYMVLMYSMLYAMLKKLWKHKEKNFFYCLLLLFVIINIKTSFFPNGGTTRFVVLMYYFFILYDSGVLVSSRNGSKLAQDLK